MARLGMMYTDLYRRPGNDRIDFYTRQELSRAGPNTYNMERNLTTIINSPSYKKVGPARQRSMLMKEALRIKDGAMDIAKGRLDKEANRRGKPYSVTTIAAWNNLSRNEQKKINELFADTYGNPESKNYDPMFEGKKIEDVMDETLQDDAGNDINALVWATGLGDFE